MSYNNLNENVLPGNFFKLGERLVNVFNILILTNHGKFLETLRALYLGDNDFEYLPPEVKNMKNLQIVSELIWFICENSNCYIKTVIARPSG